MSKEEQKINPEDIVFEESSDAGMPEPVTENYDNNKSQNNIDDNKILCPTFTFMKLFEECLEKLPYSSVLKNANGDSIKLIDLMRFMEAKHKSITVKEMNTIIGFIANVQLEYVRPLMEIIENPQRQGELWTFA